MRLSPRGSDAILQNRRFLVAGSVAFALSAIIFPIVVLAAFGHFSRGDSPASLAAGNPGGAIGPSDTAPSITSSPVMAPISETNSPTVAETSPGTTLVPMESFSPTTTPPTTTTSPGDVEETDLSPTGIPSSTLSSIGPFPSMLSSPFPSDMPYLSPSTDPTMVPSRRPSLSPTTLPLPINITYVPGELTVVQNGLLLSTGLSARVIAKTGFFVSYANGQTSSVRFHVLPDFGSTFPDPNTFNPGGWIYTSNSEAQEFGTGGVGAITFDSSGNVVDYKMVLKGTTWNCGGGRTPWNTWISCEEWGSQGQVYQVDPSGVRTAEKTVLGGSGGRFESFSYDVRNRDVPRFYVTEDVATGTLRRFTPSQPNWDDPWTILHGNGTMEYLVLEPTGSGQGTFTWVTNIETGRSSAARYYPDSEGIDVLGFQLFFVCKKIKQLFVLDLDRSTYTSSTTTSGLFDGGPDQLLHIIGGDEDVLYFTEEGGRDPGVHGRNAQGLFYTILESPQYSDETTGLAWDPSGRHLYVAFQVNGLLYDITRDDGKPFYGASLNVKYHSQGQS